MNEALAGEDIEQLRPLLPVGYEAAAAAYREAARTVTAEELTDHYGGGLKFFHDEFVPHAKATLAALSGYTWDFTDYCAYASGSDVDFMAHIINAAAQDRRVVAYPSDWFGFKVGASNPERVEFTQDSRNSLACLCIPSVRNGHLTAPMNEFLDSAESCLLNINLFPTLPSDERHAVAKALGPVLPKSIVSVSFSRGFSLTASQLGVVLVHPDHPLRRQFEKQWDWFTYFFNAIAARAFMSLDLTEIERVNCKRREWVRQWLAERNLPVVETGSYYVKSFRVEGLPAENLSPLVRDQLLRLCFKPPIH